MQAQVRKFIESTRPSFADQVLKALDVEALQEHFDRLSSHDNVSVDLRRVIGVSHPSYGDCSWKQLAGEPFGEPATAGLQRIRSRMLQLEETPDYYTSREVKPGWSFIDVDGQLYCDDGVHRTVVGRYVLEAQGLAPVVHGVSLATYRRKLVPPRDARVAEAPRKSFWQRLFG